MARLTINPADVIDYKTPLYKEDREAKKVYRLLPETTADQVQYAGGQNGEAVKAALESGIAGAQSAADAAQLTANSASASAAQAGQTADSALSMANTAKSTADGVKAQVDNTTTGLAATKTIADNALAAANEAKGAAVVMQGATADADGAQGLAPKPLAGNQNKYLRGDGTWQTPPDTDTTYNIATQSTNGLMSASDKTLFDEAKEAGQIGDPVYLGQVDANTLVETGNYIVDTNYDGVYANNWPIRVNGIPRADVTVDKQKESGIIFQKAKNSAFSVYRSGTINADDSITWNVWRFSFILFGGNVPIYISKNGSDTNTGFSPDYPVLTIGRAIEIANVIYFLNSNAQIIFCFGAGNWGNVTFQSLPFTLEITPYDGAIASEYSENLPVFGTITFFNCYALVKGIVASYLIVAYQSILRIDIGYKCIGRLRVSDNSWLMFLDSTDQSNVWEIKNNPASTSYIINIASSGSLFFRRLRIKLSQNISGDFFTLNDIGTLSLIASWVTFIQTEYTCTGRKLYANSGINYVNTYENPGVMNWLNTIPCTGAIVTNTNSLIVNGLSLSVLNGEKHITGSGTNYGPLQFINNSIDTVSPNISAGRTGLWFLDKNPYAFGNVVSEIFSNGNVSTYMQVRRTGSNGQLPPNAWDTAGLTYNREIDSSYFTAPHPPDNHNTYSVATTWWVNRKLGSTTSLTSLATLDETDPDYVETLEIKKQKAIAQVNAEAQQAIYGGFPYEINGEEYIINYSLFDQQNLASRAIIAEQNPNKIMSLPCRNDYGNKVWLDVSTDVVLAVHKYGLLSHTDAILKAADAKKTQIMAAETEAEIHAIIME